MKDTIQRCEPLAAYIGGKSKLADTIIQVINNIPHTNYVESFVGMGGIFFRRQDKARFEVINDISKDITNLFRIVRRHHHHLTDMLKYHVSARADFDALNATDPDALTDLERAARFLYLQHCSFGGKVAGRTFGTWKTRFNVHRLMDRIERLHERLSDVVIECLPYEQVLIRYDKQDMLFYLDPPYWGFENYYGKSVFERKDFDALARILINIKGKFLVSLNDEVGVRDCFGSFHMKQVSTRYTAGGKQKSVKEVLISNVDGLW